MPLAEALQRANTALDDAQQNMQEANQHTREIMGLIGQQWASLAPSQSEAGGGSSGKIEIFSDPGPYDSSKAKFKEWWMKAHAWMDCNPHHFITKDADGDLVPSAKMRVLLRERHRRSRKESKESFKVGRGLIEASRGK